MQRPIDYVPRLNEKYQSLGFPEYRWTIHTETPLTPPTKPLAECTVSLLTSGGVSLRDAPPFDPDARNDLRLDAIPNDAPSSAFQIHDNYYDHTDAGRDINCIFPIDRLRELAAEGTIGGVAARLWSGFMGRIYIRSTVTDEAAPAFVRELEADGVDILVLVPACPLDHQTAGLVSRVAEAAGIVTVNVSTGRDLTRQVMPPRSVFVNFPMGNCFGRPGDVEQQTRILRDALELAASDCAPGALVDLPYDWGEPFEVYFRDTTREYQLKK
ncbi:MAG: glycine/sarcosine/betaine reductase selenoprotein B family protein [Thermoanaerobaculia bacterium]|nr:glycine/sarcosine/betaine reductase selenoprotein B family protein [Thermoanaerobaculia bacterium]